MSMNTGTSPSRTSRKPLIQRMNGAMMNGTVGVLTRLRQSSELWEALAGHRGRFGDTDKVLQPVVAVKPRRRSLLGRPRRNNASPRSEQSGHRNALPARVSPGQRVGSKNAKLYVFLGQAADAQRTGRERTSTAHLRSLEAAERSPSALVHSEARSYRRHTSRSQRHTGKRAASGLPESPYQGLVAVQAVAPAWRVSAKGNGGTMPAKRDLRERFWEKVTTSGECWVWQGCSAKGYGTVAIGRKMALAHRLSFGWANPEKSIAGLVVDHLCRNTLCVRPEHLRAITQRENVAGNQHSPTTGRFIRMADVSGEPGAEG